MEELREYTNDVLYENWRTEKLLSMGVAQDSSVFKEVKYGTVDFSPLCPVSPSVVIARLCVCKRNVYSTKPN
jgi:septin family protein